MDSILIHGQKGNSNKSILDQQAVLRDIKHMPVHLRSNQRAIAQHLGVSQSLVSDLVKKGELVGHSSYLRPKLTEHQMLTRIAFIKDHVVNLDQPDRHFEAFYYRIFIDEKWFYRTTNRGSY